MTHSSRVPRRSPPPPQATVDKQQFAVRLTAEAPAISRLLSSFHTGLEEVTVVALPEGAHRPVHVNSFIDPQKGVAGAGRPARIPTPTPTPKPWAPAAPAPDGATRSSVAAR